MSVSSDFSEIKVEKEPLPDQTYDQFLESLPEKECRFGVVDFPYTVNNSKRQKLLFFAWAPDNAPIKQKMIYASSKVSLRKMLDGIYVEVQCTGDDETNYDHVLEKVLRFTNNG